MGYEMTAVEWSDKNGYVYRLEEEDDMLRLTSYYEDGSKDEAILLEPDVAQMIGNAMMQMGAGLVEWRNNQAVAK